MTTKEKLDLDFLRESSTVGELISLTDRPIRRQSLGQGRRGSLPTSRSEGTRSRSRGRQRKSGAKSVSPVTGSPTRKRSVSTSRRNSILSSSRRESAELSRRSSISNNVPTPGDRESPSKGLRTRRQSMLNVLRGELEKLPCILAVHKRRQSPDKEIDNVFTDTETGNETEGESASSSRRTLSKTNSFKLRRTSSVTPITPVLTDAEIRKLQMIHTLNQMGVNPRRLSRKDSLLSESGEAAIMEASYGARKRGSIATRVMLVAAKRKFNSSVISFETQASESKPKLLPLPKTSKETQSVTPDSEDLSDDQKQNTSKVLDLFKKPDKMKLPGIGKSKASSEEMAMESMNVFRRKLRRKKMRPKNKFRKLAKFLLLLLRAWRIHSVAINDVLVDNNTSLDMITSATNPVDLMFDVTQYKAVKEAKVSQEAIRILKKKPKERTEEEQYYIQIALRNYKSIAEYPVKMQKLIAQRSWYESYDPKRVIVREGHVPMCFYFILSGSGVVSTSAGTSQKTVMFLNRGDSFGDVAILNDSVRETTVISRERLELLVMGDTDFTDIFMSGGINNPNDPFLKSINFLDGWPVGKLIENPKKCIFSFFKRGTVLVEDSHTSEWIFVIRSGSASILKKLQTVHALRMPKMEKKLDFREEIMNMVKNETYLSHEEQLKFLHEEEKRELDDQNLLVRYYALPEINVATNDSYNELKQMREEYMNQNTLNRAMVEVAETLPPDKDEAKSETGNSSATGVTASQTKRRKMSLQNINLGKMVEKGPFMLKSGGGPRHRGDSASTHGRSMSRRSSIMSTKDGNGGDHVDVNEETNQKVDDWQKMSLPTIDEPDMVDLREKLQEYRSVFVEVQNLTKGQTFGLAEMLFEGQPNFSLVSNGAECVMIEKKFFMEHATHKHLVKLSEATYPYPSNEALQENLEAQMRWDHHKKKCLNRMLRDVRIKKADRNDARALLQIPAALKA